ncbi:ATP-binding protein [Streptomyces sp. NPDC020412]|uniref:ATP-binding protein n=1 Tax=Streptomyces sp. NPDC020412 TaxID=3365073 RepID=UPI0037B206A1
MARRHAVERPSDWGWAEGSDPMEAAALVVAELAANAVTHGLVRGRDFLLTLTVTPPWPGVPNTLRIEVADCRGEQLPLSFSATCPTSEYGRGLLLVEALATQWGVTPRFPSGKTVWAELSGPSVASGG